MTQLIFAPNRIFTFKMEAVYIVWIAKYLNKLSFTFIFFVWMYECVCVCASCFIYPIFSFAWDPLHGLWFTSVVCIPINSRTRQRKKGFLVLFWRFDFFKRDLYFVHVNVLYPRIIYERRQFNGEIQMC